MAVLNDLFMHLPDNFMISCTAFVMVVAGSMLKFGVAEN